MSSTEMCMERLLVSYPEVKKKKTVKRIALEIVITKTKAMREIVSINYLLISARADCLTGHNMKDCSSLPSSKVSQGQLYIF